MVQFFETPTAGIYDNLREVNDYWAADHDAAQRRYADREARRTYASAQRRNMAVSLDNEQFYNENAGLLDDRTGMLAGIGQRNVPNATPTRASATAPTAGPVNLQPPATATPAPSPAAHVPATEENPRVITPNTAPVAQPTTAQSGRWERVTSPSQLTPEQLRAHQDYIRANYGGVGSAARREATQRRVAELGLNYDASGNLIRRVSDANTGGLNGLPETFDISQYGDTPEVDGSADLQTAGLQSDGNDAEPDADADDGTSDYFQGINDTSTPLRPTPEMRMTQATAAHMFRRAQILAQHGDNNGADQAFGAALQSHLATVEQSRMLMYQAAAGGSRDAAAMLIADTSGLDPSRVQLQATPERTPRFIVRINTTTPEQAAAGTPPNWVSSNAEPLSRDSLIGTLLNLADRAGAAGRAELSANLQESMLRYQGTLQEIAGRERDNIRDNLTRAEIAQLDSQTRIALAQGEGRMMQDSQTGNIWLVRPGVDANGRPTSIITVLRTQDLPTPNVDDNRNETVPTPTATRVN